MKRRNLGTCYQNVIDSLSNAVFITDLNMNVIFVNRACCELFRIDYEKCLGQPCSTIFKTNHCNTENCNILRLKNGFGGTTYLENFYGHSLKVDTSFLYDNDGNHIGYTSTSTDITDLKHIEQQLKISDQRFRIAIPYTKCGIWEYDPKAKTLTRATSSKADFQIPDISHNVPEGLIASGLVHPDSEKDIYTLFHSLQENAAHSEAEIMLYTKDRQIRWYRLAFSTIFDEQHRPLKAIGISNDITLLKEVELRYLQERKYVDSVASASLSMYEVNLSKNIVKQIDGDGDTFTAESDEDVCCRLLCSSYDWYVVPSDIETVKSKFHRSALLNAFRNGKSEVSCEYRRACGGSEYWVATTATIIMPELHGDIFAFIVTKNINSKKQEQQELQKKASTDSLTGLYNRNFAIEKTSGILASRHPNTMCALYMIDVDNFKLVNDHCGHLYGDEFLFNLGLKMRTVFRKNDIICRLGGDEFFVFVHDITRDMILKKAALLTSQARTLCDKEDLNISLSIGISIIQGGDITFTDLYRQADSALYLAKNNGKNKYCVYGESNA